MRRVTGAALGIVVMGALVAPPAQARPQVEKKPVAEGHGGAVATVDLDASKIALDVLKNGGNAMDAVVAGAAALGVTEPYSAGLAGGGFIVYYDARSRRVINIDGRETAPAKMAPSTFEGIPFDQAVTSGLSVGVPGSVAQWDLALRRYGTLSLKKALKPAADLARKGFVVDQTFYDQTAANAAASPTSPPRRPSTSRTAPRPRSARRSATPTWPAPTRNWPTRAPRCCTAAGSARRSSPPSRPRPSPPARPATCGPA